MDLPMISSPTRFITESIRVASTRKVLSATAATAEPSAPVFAAALPSAESVMAALTLAAWASRRSASSSCWIFAVGSHLHDHLRHDGRDAALLFELAGRMLGGQRRFDNFHRSGSGIVFRT